MLFGSTCTALPYADDVVKLFVQKSSENGIDIIRIFDALSDVRNLQASVKQPGSRGLAQAAISYTTSPVHTIDCMSLVGRILKFGSEFYLYQEYGRGSNTTKRLVMNWLAVSRDKVVYLWKSTPMQLAGF